MKFPQSCRGGNGIFLNPTLILTSAHIMGRLDGTVDNDGHILYKSRIGSTVALTAHGKPLEARPLVVNFVRDVALLEVAPKSNPPQGTLFHHFGLANSHPDKGSILMTIDQIHDFQPAGRLIRVRAVGEKAIRAKAPWPMDNELGWIEYEDDVHPPRLINSRKMVTGSITRTTGGPWFNLHGEVAGMPSWEVRDEPVKLLLGFSVPPSSIRSVLEYAKTKRPEDPIVMDRWISSHDIPED